MNEIHQQRKLDMVITIVNLYLCSTIRDLLFALLRSIDTPDTESYILMIYDQQDIKANDFDLSFLPSYVKIQFIFRS